MSHSSVSNASTSIALFALAAWDVRSESDSESDSAAPVIPICSCYLAGTWTIEVNADVVVEGKEMKAARPIGW